MSDPRTEARDAQRKARRDGLAPAILAIYGQGKGHKTIAAELGISPRIARTILIEQGVYQPGKLKRLEGGPCSRKRAAIKHAVSEMRKRVRACMNKKPPKVKKETLAPRGLTPAERFRWLYRNNLEFRMYQIVRRRMKRFLNGQDTEANRRLIGCTMAELIAHIQGQFKKGMHWNNMGYGPGKWQIDHRMPCSSYDLSDPEQQRQCFHFSNLQPLWAKQNNAKRAKITHPQLHFAL